MTIAEQLEAIRIAGNWILFGPVCFAAFWALLEIVFTIRKYCKVVVTPELVDRFTDRLCKLTVQDLVDCAQAEK